MILLIMLKKLIVALILIGTGLYLIQNEPKASGWLIGVGCFFLIAWIVEDYIW